MLRPATPLTVLLFCAFVLLLISALSTPIVHAIPLARFQDASFGVFGYCSDSKGCSGIKLGYNTDGLFSGTSADGDFNLPASARHSLSSLLIVHPIAAFLCLVMTALAAAAHFHSPSHSPRYLLGLLILALPTLLITLLAFLVDILLFIPHVAWGGWIVLASVVLIVASGIMLCAMRRTLVSRKARKKRIAENAEMSGENFYNRQRVDEIKLTSVPAMSTESKSPLVNGSPGADNLPHHGPAYAISRHSEERSMHDTQTPISPVDQENRYYAPRSRSNSRPSPEERPPMPINQYGPPAMPNEQAILQDGSTGHYPPNAYARGRGYGPPRGRGGPGGPGGPRGGYGPPPRGYYGGPPRGAYRGPPPQGPGRGNYGPDMRGGYAPRGGPGPAMAGGAMMAGAINRRPPPGYISPQDTRQDINPYSQGQPSYEAASPSSDYGPTPSSHTYVPYGDGSTSGKGRTSSQDGRRHSEDGLARAESPPPEMPIIGHAVEMDATTGRASNYDPEVQGMVNLQRGQAFNSPPGQSPTGYVPPRAGWNHRNTGNQNIQPQNRHQTGSVVSDNSRYYEDVDPRFAQAELPTSETVQHEQQQRLQPPNVSGVNPSPEPGSLLPHTESYENIPAGARSPATSEQSAFTSISQRPVNPNWRPGHGGEFNQFGPPAPRRNDKSQARQDILLAGNPDFELPGMGPPRGVRPPRGGMRGGPMGMGRGPLPPSALGLGDDGRYPQPVVPSGPNSVREL